MCMSITLVSSRVNVDKDLMMAVQTLKNRGLDTNEEAALGIHIDLRNMLVSVAPVRLWRVKHGLRWALRCRALPGKNMGSALGTHDFCGPAPTRRAQCALCPQ